MTRYAVLCMYSRFDDSGKLGNDSKEYLGCLLISADELH
jgi:hypothetical protein